MQISLDTNSATYQIRAYEAHRIRVNNEWITHSFIITPNQLINPWRPGSVNDLKISDIDPIVALNPEVVLLGTGTKINFLNPKLLAPLYTLHVGVEIMDTAAACRTYNVLMSEGRNVVAALLCSPL